MPRPPPALDMAPITHNQGGLDPAETRTEKASSEGAGQRFSPGSVPLTHGLTPVPCYLAAIMPWGSGDNDRQVVYKSFWVDQMGTEKQKQKQTKKANPQRARHWEE